MPEPLKGFPFDECDTFIERTNTRPHAMKVFAIGDSWLTVPGGWWSGRSVVQRLNDPAWVKSVDPSLPQFNVVSISKVGMLAADMATDRHLIAIDYIRSELKQSLPFDAIMISAGGNDIIPGIRSLVSRVNGAAQINQAGWDAMLTSLKASWQALLDISNQLRAPIVTNGYGAIIPTTKPGTTWLPFLGIGPWTGPYLLQDLQLSPADAKGIVKDVIDLYNDYLAGLQGVSYFDLRDIIDQMPATIWHDEIHFLDAGWDTVAREWARKLQSVLSQPRGLPVAPMMKTRVSSRPLSAPVGGKKPGVAKRTGKALKKESRAPSKAKKPAGRAKTKPSKTSARRPVASTSRRKR